MIWDFDGSSPPTVGDGIDAGQAVAGGLLDASSSSASGHAGATDRRIGLPRVLLVWTTLTGLAVLSPRSAVIAMVLQLVWTGWGWMWFQRLALRVAVGWWPLTLVIVAASAAGALYTADRQPEAIPYLLASIPLGFHVRVARRSAREWWDTRGTAGPEQLPLGG